MALPKRVSGFYEPRGEPVYLLHEGPTLLTGDSAYWLLITPSQARWLRDPVELFAHMGDPDLRRTAREYLSPLAWRERCKGNQTYLTGYMSPMTLRVNKYELCQHSWVVIPGDYYLSSSKQGLVKGLHYE